MKKLFVFLVVAGLVIGGTGLAQASNVTLTPADLIGDPRPGSQTPPTFTGLYAWDWDSQKPIGSLAVGGAPGFGDSSWYAGVSGSASGTGLAYTALRLFPENIFGEAITVSEFSDITYWSNWISGTVDWQVKIYTKPTEGAVSGAWYNTRTNYNRGNMPGQGWQYWSAAALGVNSTSDKNPTSTYLNEEIMLIDIIASYATLSPASYTYLDGVTISLTENRSQSMDLAVPEPATMLLLGLGLVGLAGIRRRMR